MNEWWLLSSFVLLFLLALGLILYPLRQSKLICLALIPLLFMVLSLSYWRWGAWPLWQNHLHVLAKQEKIQALLARVKSPADMAEKLKARLADTPESSRGWYLLGRLYASQNQWSAARDAFAKASQLNPQDELATINYGQSLWQLNHQRFDEEIRSIFKALLEKNPQQPDALAMLAMDAFAEKNYPKAIDYWQQLLKLAPPQSEEAQMIRKAIAKAQQSL